MILPWKISHVQTDAPNFPPSRRKSPKYRGKQGQVVSPLLSSNSTPFYNMSQDCLENKGMFHLPVNTKAPVSLKHIGK